MYYHWHQPTENLQYIGLIIHVLPLASANREPAIYRPNTCITSGISQQENLQYIGLIHVLPVTPANREPAIYRPSTCITSNTSQQRT